MVGLVNFYCKLYSLWLFWHGRRVSFSIHYASILCVVCPCACVFVVWVWRSLMYPKMHGRDLFMLLFIRQLPHAAENNLFWLILGFFRWCCCYCWLEILLSYIIEWDSNNTNNNHVHENSSEEHPKQPAQQCILWAKEKKNWIGNFNFCLLHEMWPLSHYEWKDERVFILLLELKTPFQKREYIFFFQANGCKSMIKFDRTQKAYNEETFNGDSMYCLRTTRPTNQPCPKRNSNQLRECSTQSQKPYTPYSTAQHSIHLSKICLYW